MTRITDSDRFLRMTEAQLQRNIFDAAAKLGFLCYHTKCAIGSKRGFPDVVMVRLDLMFRGTWLIFAELKNATKPPTDEQLHWLRLLDRPLFGVRAFLWRPAHWQSGEIDTVLRP